MWNLLAGTGGAGLGRPSGLLETGSYALVTLADLGGLDPFVCVPPGRLIAGLAALPISRVAFRLQGGDFAIGTWVIRGVSPHRREYPGPRRWLRTEPHLDARLSASAPRGRDVLDGPGLAGPRSGLDLLAAALALRHSGKSVRSPSETGQIPRKGRGENFRNPHPAARTGTLLARKGYRVLAVDQATFPSDTIHARRASARRGRAVAVGPARSPQGDRVPAGSHVRVRLRSLHHQRVARHGGCAGCALPATDDSGQAARRRACPPAPRRPKRDNAQVNRPAPRYPALLCPPPGFRPEGHGGSVAETRSAAASPVPTLG
jgi:hypothetical protein